MISANEINAIQGLGPNWAPLILVVVFLAPVLVALVNREKKKPEDPLVAIYQELRALRKLTEDNADETKALRRDMDRIELRSEVLAAIKNMSSPKR